jgi:hypothetical protein
MCGFGVSAQRIKHPHKPGTSAAALPLKRMTFNGSLLLVSEACKNVIRRVKACAEPSAPATCNITPRSRICVQLRALMQWIDVFNFATVACLLSESEDGRGPWVPHHQLPKSIFENSPGSGRQLAFEASLHRRRSSTGAKRQVRGVRLS